MLGDIPKPMGRAERAMREARDALASDRSGDALPPQQRAVDQLQQGMEAMVERFMRQMGQSNDRGSGPLGARAGEGRDPFGRQTGPDGLEALEGVRIPEEAEVQRSREIRDELRRRRSDPERPPVELGLHRSSLEAVLITRSDRSIGFRFRRDCRPVPRGSVLCPAEPTKSSPMLSRARVTFVPSSSVA